MGQKNNATVNHKYFSSCCGTCALSNFAAAKVVLREAAYPSSEHAYQATKFIAEDRPRFQVGGDLATFDTFLKFYPAQEAAKKIKFWSSTRGGKRPSMIGIVAKMASLPTRSVELGLTFECYEESHDREEELIAIFKEILIAKYTQNPLSLSALKATGDATLVEFGRLAGRDTAAGRPPLWTGLVKDGQILGNNLMGRIMEMVRTELTVAEA